MASAKSIKNSLIKIAPRISKAVVKGFLWFLILYMIPMFILSASGIPVDLFPDYTRFLGVFAGITVFFVVAAELFSKTVFQHVFNMAKALVLIVFSVYALNGGFVTVNFVTLHIMVDLRVYLAMLLTINFLGLTKGALQTLNFLSERTEKSLPLERE